MATAGSGKNLEQMLPGVRSNGLNVAVAADINGVTVDTSGNMVVPGTLATTGAQTFTASVTVSDSANFVLGTTTGSKIGTATTQKLAFFNSTPVVQPATTGAVATTDAGATTAVYVGTTFTGGSGTTPYTVADIVKALKALGLLAA